MWKAVVVDQIPDQHGVERGQVPDAHRGDDRSIDVLLLLVGVHPLLPLLRWPKHARLSPAVVPRPGGAREHPHLPHCARDARSLVQPLGCR
jgi:hypothetical protein